MRGVLMPEIVTASNLEGLANLRHGFFTRDWGNCGISEKFDAGELAANRARVAQYFHVQPENLLSCLQIHSADVLTVTESWPTSQRPRADAMVTDRKGIALGILTADCGPLLFVDVGAGVIGAAHAGWRGALAGIIENTIAAMVRLGARRSRIHAALGPCIGWNSYEVGPEFPTLFLAESWANEKLFRPSSRADHYMFDLPGYIEMKIDDAAIPSFTSVSADTSANEARFFSYRRDTLRKVSPTESLISVVALNP